MPSVVPPIEEIVKKALSAMNVSSYNVVGLMVSPSDYGEFIFPSGERFRMSHRDITACIEKARTDRGPYVHIPTEEVNSRSFIEMFVGFMTYFFTQENHYSREDKRKKRRTGFTDNYKTYDDSEERGSSYEWRQQGPKFNAFNKDRFSSFFKSGRRQGSDPFSKMSEEEMNDFFNSMFGKGSFSGDHAKDRKDDKNNRHDKQSKDHSFRGEAPPRAQTHYEILGVSIHATRVEIRKAYITKIREWHPDLNPHRLKEAEEMSKKINQAYSVLTA